MSLLSKFKEPLHKNDIMPVIRQGIFMSFVGGLLIGSIQMLFFYMFDFSLLWLMLFVFAYQLAKRVRGAYMEYHILFSVLSVFFFIFGFYLYNTTFYIGLFSLTMELELKQILYIMNPSIAFQFLNPFSGFFFDVNNILDVVFFLIGGFYAYRYSK
jgi:hypothetical protein